MFVDLLLLPYTVFELNIYYILNKLKENMYVVSFIKRYILTRSRAKVSSLVKTLQSQNEDPIQWP